jgi:putative protease
LGNVVEMISGYNVIRANNSATSKEKITQQFSKLNDTSYYLNSIDIHSDEMVLIPVSIINELRRSLIEKLNEARSVINKREGKKKLNLEKVSVEGDPFGLKIKVSNNQQYQIAREYVEDKDIYYNKENNVYPYPRISENKINVSHSAILVNELHDLCENKKLIANYYMNCTNIFALYSLYKLGCKRVTLSIEMTKTRVFDLIKNYINFFNEKPNVELVIYSKTDLMITKYCMINKCLNKDNKECGECLKSKYYLEDRKGYKIPLVKDYFCNIRMLNPRALMLFEYLDEIKENGVNCVRIEFTNEDENECIDILKNYNKENVELDSRKFTYGYFKEKEEC